MAIALSLLTGCGPGDAAKKTAATAATGQTITGVVATGAPLAGATVTIKDSAPGSASKTVTGTTNSKGAFSISVTGMTPPFMLVATKSGQQNMYSVLPAMDMTTANTQNVNITQITTLVMYELNNGADPSAMYQTGGFSTVTAGAVAAKEVKVRSNPNLPVNSVNPIFSMMYGQFTAGATDSTGYDVWLDAIGPIVSINSSQVTLHAGGTIQYTVSSGGGTGATSAPSVTLALRNLADTASVTSIDSNTPALVKAVVQDANGAAVGNAIVTFSTNSAFGSFLGGTNTALTDGYGIAKVTLTTSSTSGGASTVAANTTVAGTSTSGTINYAVGASTISLSAITVGANPLSAYGTTSVSVTVLNNGVAYTSPMPVTFTSTCAASGKATLTSSVTTVNGVATASYLDNGCNNPTAGDTITASLSNGTSTTGSLKVSAPALGSIQFVSVVTNPATTPPVITLKGTGGANRSETAKVTFRVADSAGNPAGGQTVNFSLNTSVGGLALGATSAISDPVTGNVVTNVISGTVSTAVRVTATTGALSSQSDQLVISTGIPAQDGISLSAGTHNIEGWTVDGVTTTLTARLADHFRNPVPDGTAVYFTAEGGSVLPSCTTVGGMCTTTFSSQNLRPTNGRVTVLARAVGEEAFTDLNGNGTADSAGEMIDANSASTDMAEAYVDYNENGVRDANEPFFDFDSNGVYNSADGKYNGVLCTSGALICSTQKSIDVRASQVIVFSTSEALVSINGGAPITLPTCAPGVSPPTLTFPVTVVDGHGNAMPAGTTVAFSSDNGTITSDTTHVIPDDIGCRTGYSGCPASNGSPTVGDIYVTMKSDSWVSGVCYPQNSNLGTFTVKVTTPKGLITTVTTAIQD